MPMWDDPEDVAQNKADIKKREPMITEAKIDSPKGPDFAEARKVYQAYLLRVKELAPHQAYAERVSRATGGGGQTPVCPLATMGTNGKALLCDICGKPMVLEGGGYQGLYADEGWRRNSKAGPGWRSYISGGMVVETQTNGTLRIYHGYQGHDDKHCCNIASKQNKKAWEDFKSDRNVDDDLILEFLEQEFPDMAEKERLALFDDVYNTMYMYDPGIGVNCPSVS